MENSTLDNDFNTPNELYIDGESRMFLKETAKWAKFLAIVGFVITGLMVLVGLFMGTIMSEMTSGMGGEMPGYPVGMLSGVYIVFAILYIMPMLYLYKFAAKMQVALKEDIQFEITSSFENLKSLFKFIGIFTVVILGFYVLIFLFGLAGGVMSL